MLVMQMEEAQGAGPAAAKKSNIVVWIFLSIDYTDSAADPECVYSINEGRISTTIWISDLCTSAFCIFSCLLSSRCVSSISILKDGSPLVQLVLFQPDPYKSTTLQARYNFESSIARKDRGSSFVNHLRQLSSPRSTVRARRGFEGRVLPVHGDHSWV